MSELDRQADGWMRALTAGDESAFTALVDGWQTPVLRFVYRYVQNEEEARDVVQETFLRVYVKRATFRPDMRFSSWIFTIAANLCRNVRRSWRRRPTDSLGAGDEAEGGGLVCHQPTPDQAIVKAERIAAVRRALDDLPHDLKVPILLHEYENMGYAEIAPVIGCSVKGVEARLTKARAKLRQALAGHLGDGVAEGKSGGMPQPLVSIPSK